MSDINNNSQGIAADADAMIHDDELHTGSSQQSSVTELLKQNQRLARLNKNKSVIWYLDNSGSMQTFILSKDAQLNRHGYYDYDDPKNGNYRYAIMRSAVAKMVEQRLAESPDAQLNVFKFAAKPSPVFASNSKNEIKTMLETQITANGGSTNICACFEYALNWVEKHPNDVGVYHMMLVTDAEDYISESTAIEYEQRFRKAGIVLEVTLIGNYEEPDAEKQAKLDAAAKAREEALKHAAGGAAEFTFDGDGNIVFADDDDEIVDTYDGFDEEEFFIPTNAGECAHILRRLAAKTGGTFRAVSSAEAMTLQITTSATRLCLPPAPNA